MRIDCHNHANYSPDASQTLEELAETAVRAGVGYLAVTEHMDLGFPNDKRPEGELIFDYRVNERYFSDIGALRETSIMLLPQNMPSSVKPSEPPT